MKKKERKKDKTEIMNPQRRRLKLPLKTRVFLFFISSASDAFRRRRDGTVNRRLLSLMGSHLGLKTGPRSKPDRHGVRASDVTVDPARSLWFRVYVPTKSIDSSEQKLPVVVFFHGGGFVYLSADMKVYDAVCRRFARKIPAVVVSVDYRLAPEHRYPAQYEDGFDVLKFLDENKGGVLPPCADLKRCFLAGDSAGGNIAHHVTVRLCKENDFSNLKVLGVLNIQPFFGGEERTKAELELANTDVLVSMERTDWMWRAFMSDVDRDHPAINVSGPRAEDISKLDNFPPVAVVIAGFDSLKDWQMRYYQWLKNSGKDVYLVEFPNAFHAFYVFPEVPESGQLMAEAKKFVETRCSKAVVGN